VLCGDGTRPIIIAMMTRALVPAQVFVDPHTHRKEPKAGIRKAHGFFCLKGGDGVLS